MHQDNTGDQSPQLRKLPSVDRLSNSLAAHFAPPLRVRAARTAIENAARSILGGGRAPSFDDLQAAANSLAHAQARSWLIPVINATGVLLHTNLGRAPLAPSALRAIENVAQGYSNLEYDLSRGSRGSRYEHACELLKMVTGAESAVVVNNNAAAVLLALAVSARGRQVIVSRGELIEIGGEFRIPEIMAESGALLREVGTTNRTHLKDYAKAISTDTGAILKVHPSNYRVVGFAASVAPSELAKLCRQNNLSFIHDLGSGLLQRKIAGFQPSWLSQEPSVAQSVQDGADLVCFSGDKLIGGPQAGILIGKHEMIRRCRESPLLRAFRVDKTTLAALEATLNLYLEGREAEIPLWSMALTTPAEIEARGAAIIASVPDAEAKLDLRDGFSTPGGGSAPGTGIPTVLIEIAPREASPQQVLRALTDFDPPIIGRIENDRVILDLRTVDPRRDSVVSEALRQILK